MRINILGNEWEIKFQKEEENQGLQNRDGYCDRTIKTIFIAEDRGVSGFADYKKYQKECIRHEITHAFLCESGLDNNWQHCEQFGHDETMIDWFAIQFPKLLKAFEDADAI